MTKIILDTNMLLVPGQFKVDIFSEIERIMDEPYDIVVLEGTLKELEKIASSGKGADKMSAKLGRMLLEHNMKKDFAAVSGNCKSLKVVSSFSDSYVDDAIVSIAEDDTLVATNDAGLKRRLLEKGSRVIFLKQQQYLELA